MPNKPPTLIGLSSSVVFGENAVNAAPALLDSDVTFSDPDGNLTGGVVTVSGLLGEDRLSIRNQGFGAGQIGLFGANVTYGGIAIGTFSGGAGTTLTINLNSAATTASVEALLENLAYANVSNDPTEVRTLTVAVRDGAGAPVVPTASFAPLAGAANPLNAIDAGLNSAPAFTDLDGDGDQDLVSGSRDGTLQVWRNDAGSYAAVAAGANPFALVDVGTYSRPVFVDLDGDGDRDLVVGSTAGDFRTFLNAGAVFTAATGSANPFNGINVGSESAPAFGDFDNDGDLDLVSGEIGGTYRSFRNSGGSFTELTGSANPFAGIDVGFFATGAFMDIDGDGDDDFVITGVSGTLSVLRNQAGSFVGFAGEPSPFATQPSAGSYATPTFVDIDGDGDLDFVSGQGLGTFSVQRNDTPIGRAIEVHVTAQSDVPVLTDVAASLSVLENAVNAVPVLVDADVTFALGSAGLAGGRLIVSGLLPEDRISVVAEGLIGVSGSTITHGGIIIGTVSGGQGNSFVVSLTAAAGAAEVEALIEHLGYANVSQTPAADRTLHFNIVDSAGGALDAPLALTPFAVNPLGTIGSGLSNPTPAFTDLDGDGDADLVLGDLYGLLQAFRNDGGSYVDLGATNPFLGIDAFFDSAPAFVDLDGDGDKDLILGTDNVPGQLRTYRNEGGAWLQLTGADDPFAGTAFGRATAPAPADIDGDGDIDLVVGDINGHIRYFESTGGAFVERTGSANPFAAITTGNYAAPAWIDVDGDGDQDLVVGSWVGSDGSLRTWRNDGGSFTELTGPANPFGGLNLGGVFGARPAFVDLDGDGDLDTVVGTGGGEVRSYRNDGSSGPSIAIHVVAEGDLPSLSGLASAVSFGENAVNTAPAPLDTDVTFSAGSGGLGGGTLTVGGLLAEDRVGIRSEGPIALSGPSVSYLGTVIGTVSGGQGTDLVIVFTASAGSAAVEALIERLSYANASDNPAPSRTLTLDLIDGNGDAASGGPHSVAVTVSAENDAPTLAGLAAAATFAENEVNAAPVLIDAVVDFGDPEANIAGGALTVSGLLAEDTIAVRDQGLGANTIALFGANVIYDGVAIGTFSGGNGATFTVSFNSAATIAGVDALIQSITYANASDTPTAVRTLTLSITDAMGATLSSDIALDVTAVNDAPANVVGATVNINEDDVNVVLSATGSPMSVSDVDASGPISYSLSVAHGTLTIRTNVGGGIAAGDVSGNGTSLLTITATTAQINATLSASNALLYTPTANYNGTDALAVSANDGGQTGVDPGLTGGLADEQDNDTRTISIDAVVDTPVAQNDVVTTAENVIGTGSVFADNGSGVDVDVDGPLAISAVNGVSASVGAQITLLSGAKLTLNGNGTYSYDPAGAFNYLISDATAVATGALNTSATDSFSYTLIGGATATVTMTVTGVASADDQLWGNGGGNTIMGTLGADYFDLSQGGNDFATGDDGNDGFYFGAVFNAADSIDGGAGTNDQIGLRGDYSGGLALGLNTILGIEVMAVLPGFDYSITTVNQNVPSGGTLKIFAGSLGAGDNLTFNGSAELDGNFMVYGGAGTDIVTTGAGNDGIYFGPGKFDPTVDRADGGAGANDQLALDGHYAITLDGTAIQNIDVIALLRGETAHLATYSLTVANSLIGATETMTLWGTKVETAITINGEAETDGNLRMFGGTAADTLIGGAGDDWFWGGLGADVMTGGAGVDTFNYTDAAQSLAGAYDRIFDFDQNADKIDLSFAVTGFAGSPSGGSLSAATMGTQLEAAFTGLAANQAAGFVASGGDLAGSFFLVIDANGLTGYQAGSDFLIEFVSPVTSPIANIGMFI